MFSHEQSKNPRYAVLILATQLFILCKLCWYIPRLDMMKTEQASGRQPPKAKNVIPITDSGIKKVCPRANNEIKLDN